MITIHDLQYLDSSGCGQLTALLSKTSNSRERTAFRAIFKSSTSRIESARTNRAFLHFEREWHVQWTDLPDNGGHAQRWMLLIRIHFQLDHLKAF